MKPDIKAEWVAALRSGKYKQTNCVLKDDTGFCCLGVLCDVVKDRVGLSWMETGGHDETFFTMGDAIVRLPSQVYIFAGLDSASPSICDGTLIYLNDIEKWDFNAIAAAIEAAL